MLSKYILRVPSTCSSTLKLFWLKSVKRSVIIILEMKIWDGVTFLNFFFFNVKDLWIDFWTTPYNTNMKTLISKKSYIVLRTFLATKISILDHKYNWNCEKKPIDVRKTKQSFEIYVDNSFSCSKLFLNIKKYVRYKKPEKPHVENELSRAVL